MKAGPQVVHRNADDLQSVAATKTSQLDQHVHRTIDALDGSVQSVVGTVSLVFDGDGIAAGGADNVDTTAKFDAARRARHVGTTIGPGREVTIGIETMHGNFTPEARYFRTLGISPKRAIHTLTTDAAHASGLRDRVGRLDPGYAADAVFVADHPLDAPDTFAEPTAVIERGDLT